MKTTISLFLVSLGISYGLTNTPCCEAFVVKTSIQVVNRKPLQENNGLKVFETSTSDITKNNTSRSWGSCKSQEQLRERLRKQLERIEQVSLSQNGEENGKSTTQSFQDPEMSFLESNIFNAIRSCNNVTEVRDLLLDLVSFSKKMILTNSLPIDARSIDDLSEPHLDDISILGPNIAAYALRKVAILFDKGSIHHNASIISEEENLIARGLFSALMKSFGNLMDEENSTRKAFLTSEGQFEKNPKTNENGLVSFSFTDFLKSLSMIVTAIDSNAPPTIVDVDDKKSRTVCHSALSPSISLYSFINMITSLAKLSLMQSNISKRIKSTSDTTNKSKFQPFATKICERMMEEYKNPPKSHDTGAVKLITSVQPKKLIELLSALATLHLVNETELLSVLEGRLICGDVVGRLSGRELSLGLWSYTRLSYPHKRLLKAYTRRLRKVKVRTNLSEYDICRALWAVAQSMKTLSTSFDGASRIDKDFVDQEKSSLLHDSETMVYTLSTELLKEDERGISKIDHLNFLQLADVLFSLSVFDFDNERLLSRLIDRLHQNNVFSEADVKGVTRVLASLQKIRLNDESEIVVLLIERFVEVVERELGGYCDPKTFTIILRSAVMLSGDKHSTQEALKVLSLQLLSSSSYLSQCNEYELSNFVWYLAMSSYYDKRILQTVTERMKEKDIVVSCSTSSASRFLWSFTKIVERDNVDLEMRERLYEMFQCLGRNLIKDPLSPLDSSSAMWAMAKSSYSLDMNIFDHLAEELASENSLNLAKVRHISEGLWSCGKMISWEDPLREKIEYGDFNPPPYTDSAKTFASFLIRSSDQLSPKDIAQAIWAIGRLKINDSGIIERMATIAEMTAEKQLFNSQEIANIIWGLSKVGFDNALSIKMFTKQLKNPSILKTCTPQEASNVMYALALMNINDEDTFTLMNNVLMNQLNDATTQTIANALWAHEIVNLQPPQLLFNQWAKEKLEITGLYLGDEESM